MRAAEAEVERSRAAAEAAEQALRTVAGRRAAAREPAQAAETERAKLRAEIQALTELLAAASDKRWTPVLDAHPRRCPATRRRSARRWATI